MNFDQIQIEEDPSQLVNINELMKQRAYNQTVTEGDLANPLSA